MATPSDRLLSPLSRNILLINLTTLLIPLVGFLYLADYRKDLLSAEISSLRQESIIFSNAMAEATISQFDNGLEVLQLAQAIQILHHLSRTSGERAILFLEDGTVVADSKALNTDIVRRPLDKTLIEKGLHSAHTLLHKTLDQLEPQTIPPKFVEPVFINIRAFPHVIDSLSGKVAHKVWRNEEDTGLVISVAAPIQLLHHVFGSLMLIKKTTLVDEAVKQVRENILITFLIALFISITLSLLLARTIAKPLSQLAKAAHRFGQPDQELRELNIPIVGTPKDEIGALSRAVHHMSETLKRRIDSIEGFSADVAHEIRNPVAAIKSVIETLPILKSEEKRDELMGMAIKELTRIDHLITDILEASRLDSALINETADMINLVQETQKFCEYYQSLYDDHPIETHFPDMPIKMRIRTSRLTQLLQNLLDNSRDFSPPNAPIEVRIVLVDKAVRLIVADCGAGIPEESLDKIFARFYSDRKRAKNQNHTGLGLSISQQVIESYGGTIKARNQQPPKTGAIFTVTFPLA